MSVLMLFITALIWGVAFVAQSVGMDHLGPFSFNAIRYLMGAVVLIPVITIIRRSNGKKGITGYVRGTTEYGTMIATTIKGGVCCGTLLCVASLFQQFGIKYTTVGKAGFVTALYIIIVPFISVFLRRKIAARAWIAAVVAVAGFYLMCINETMSIAPGDGLVLIGSFIWAAHILVIDHFAPDADCVMLSSIQFAVSGTLCLIMSLIFETITWDAVWAAMIPLLYAGVMSSGVAYTLQVVGQKNVKPTVACIILSLESVFSALAGWAILGEKMKAIELAGCILVFAGVIIAQLPERKKD